MAMNLVDAAVAVLGEVGTALHVEELCREVERRKLVKSQKQALLRSMKGRLTTEAKKGDDSKLVRVAPDTWALRNGAGAVVVADPAAAAPAKAKAAQPAAPAKAAAIERAAPAQEASLEPAPEVPSGSVAEAQAEPAPEVPVPAADVNPELAALYADEAETVPVAELTEYRDELTADEDRPMLPEIVAQRRGRPGQRERRGRDRERRRRGKRDTNGQTAREVAVDEAAAAARTDREQAPADLPEVSGAIPEPSPLADGAYEILRAQGDRPVQVKQLAQMMRKRNFITGDPQAQWKLLRAAIEADEELRRARGLRPRFVDCGRDLYAARGRDVSAELSRAEAAFAQAAATLEQATHAAIAARISALDAAGFERLVHLYLLRTGHRRIEWIKRVGPSCYAVTEPPDRLGKMLVSARSGADPVDRRGVGELRAGVEAKALDRGLLIAATSLSSIARSELARDGKPIMTLVGDDFVRALSASSIGVIAATTRVSYVDPGFFEKLR